MAGLPVEINPLFLSSSGGYTVGRSLRFRSSANAYLSRTIGTPSTTTNTISVWVKRGSTINSAYNPILGCTNSNSLVNFQLPSTSLNDTLQYVDNNTSILATNAVYRDPSAWYHVVFVWDTTNATAANRLRLYVNGVQVTSFNYANYPAQNAAQSLFTAGNTWQIGSRQYPGALYFDGYMAEFIYVDGQALTASSFGAYDTNGVWQPIKYTGTYGTNGFYLPFSNTTSTTTLVQDSSGNGNNWTPNNISLTAGATYDSMIDSPTVSASSSNYCTLNPLRSNTSGSLSEANMRYSNGSSVNQAISVSTIGISTGKYYWEGTIAQIFNDTSRHKFGFATSSSSISADLPFQIAAVTAGATAVNQVVMIAIDFDAGKIWYGAQGTWVSSGSPSTGTNPYQTFTPSSYDYLYPAVNVYAGADGTSSVQVNFGQRPFTYTPPTGYSALNTYNLPTPTIKNGALYNAATLYTGTGSSQTIANSQSNGGNNPLGSTFYPDFTWVKSRSAATDNKLTDSVRGVTKALVSNTTAAETTDTNGVTAFSSNSFTVGSDSNYNTNGATYVAWQWNLSIPAGFAISTYTGNGSSVFASHNLGVAPAFIIIKSRSNVLNWIVYHQSLGTNYYVQLNTNSVQINYNGFINPTSSGVYYGGLSDINTNGATYVSYQWAAIKGYSAFGSYTGNGNADGPFIYTGFRPRWVLIKNINQGAEPWMLQDTSRSPYNLVDNYLRPNYPNAETSGANASSFDYLSNGFKVRNSGLTNNGNGNTIIYAAFAENPFNYSRAR